MSSVPALGRSGELGADAMAEELMRRGDETRGPTGLRLPRPREGTVVPPTPLLAGCGDKKVERRGSVSGDH